MATPRRESPFAKNTFPRLSRQKQAHLLYQDLVEQLNPKISLLFLVKKIPLRRNCDTINVLMTAAAFNCRKWMRAVADGLIFVLFALYAIQRGKDEPKRLAT